MQLDRFSVDIIVAGVSDQNHSGSKQQLDSASVGITRDPAGSDRSFKK